MRIALDARQLTKIDSGIGNYTLIWHTLRQQARLHNPRITEVIFPFPPISPCTQFTLGPFLRRQHCDVFHTPFDVALRGLNRPLVVTIHDLNWIVNSYYSFGWSNCAKAMLAVYRKLVCRVLLRI